MEMYVAGEWCRAAREEEVVNPYDGSVIDTVPVAGAAEAERALAAAVEGARAMRGLSAYERTEIVRRAAELVAGSIDELAQTIALEVGKPLAEASGEAARIPDLLRVSAAEGARLHGETVPVDASANGAGRLGLTMRQPCGIVVAITPFNYPALLTGHKIGPALAAGERGDPQAGAQHSPDRPLAHAKAPRGRASRERAPMPHGAGLRARDASCAPTRGSARSASRARPRWERTSRASPG